MSMADIEPNKVCHVRIMCVFNVYFFYLLGFTSGCETGGDVVNTTHKAANRATAIWVCGKFPIVFVAINTDFCTQEVGPSPAVLVLCCAVFLKRLCGDKKNCFSSPESDHLQLSLQWWNHMFFEETWGHSQLFLWQLKLALSHGKSDHLQPL